MLQPNTSPDSVASGWPTSGGGEWIAEIQGSRLSIKHRRYRPPKPQPKKRKEISGFSPAARRRLLHFLASVNWDVIPESSFITLTYPDEVIHTDIRKRNTERYLLHRYLEAHAGGEVPAVWRVEWVPRKSGANIGKVLPHMHMLTFGGRYACAPRVAKWWKGITKYDGVIQVDSQIVSAGEIVGMYVAKYCAKAEGRSSYLDNVSYLNTGRHYGMFRKSSVPMHATKICNLTLGKLVKELRAEAVKVLPAYHEKWGEGFTFVGQPARAAIQKIIVSGLAIGDPER